MKKRDVGFTLVELLAVLVILALLILLAGSSVIKLINGLEKDDDSNELYKSRRKTVENAAEQWSLDNLDKFDDIEGSTIKVGLDVVFIMDASGGMRLSMPGSSHIGKTLAMLKSADIVLQSLQDNDLNRVGFVFFGGTATTSICGRDENVDVIPLTSAQNVKFEYNTVNQSGVETVLNLKVMKDKVELKPTNGVTNEKVSPISLGKGTNTIMGIQFATELFLDSRKSEESRIPVVILLTDGEPSVGKTGQMDILNFNELTGLDWGAGGTTWCLGGSTWNVAKEKAKTLDNQSTNYTYGFCPKAGTKVTNELKGLSSSKITENSAVMYWNTVARAAAAKQEISRAYKGSKVFFYTFGIGLTSDLGRFVLAPNKDNLDNMSSTSSTRCNKIKKSGGTHCSGNYYDYYDHLWHIEIEEQLYNLIISRNDPTSPYYSTYSKYSYPSIKDYNYPTEAYTDNNMTLEFLQQKFSHISDVINKATKVTTVCVTLDKLLREGYLNSNAPKSLKIDKTDMKNHYVIVSMNEATNQYAYTYLDNNSAEDSPAIETCKTYLEKNPED